MRRSGEYPVPGTRYLPWHLMMIVVMGAAACGGSEQAPAAVPTPTPTVAEQPAPPGLVADPAALHHGVDVSVHSGTVTWAEVKEGGHSFAFVKATEGVDLEDGAFDAHWPALRDAGLYRGAYHFFVTEDDPEEQARFFIETVALEPGDLAPVVDIELIGHGTELEGLVERLQRFLDLLEAHYGVKPIIYTSPKFWDTHFGAGFSDYPLWVAEYGVDSPTIPAGWERWHLWQWRGDAEVKGVEKGADLTKVNREGVDLAQLFVPR